MDIGVGAGGNTDVGRTLPKVEVVGAAEKGDG